MEAAIEYPGLVWVKDPVNLAGELTGSPPRRRHHDDCMHFEHAPDGSLIGPPPYRASEEQMRTLRPCLTCAESLPGYGGPGGARAERRGDVCPSCFMERPVAGPCPNCDEE